MITQNLMMFHTKLGHFDQVFSPTLSYLVSSFTTHSVHRCPVYPSLHSIGCSLSGSYPPLQDSGFGHRTTSVEFSVFRQYLFSIITLSLPDQIALSIHGTHSVEFQFSEYVPAFHGLHVELSIMTSPGFQYLNDTEMVSFVVRLR